MNHKERMLSGLPYKGSEDGLPKERIHARRLNLEYNRLDPSEVERAQAILLELIGKTAGPFVIVPPFQCDYGYNIELGENFYSNFNLVILDVAKVTIGKNVKIGPNVSLITAGHPIHPVSRASGYEYGMPITIGNDVWLGSNVVVNPGVSIGSGTVIGSGSVVTKDIPDGVVAFGNPCRVSRKITNEEKEFYFRDRRFDVDDYL